MAQHRLESIVWEIRSVALHEGNDLTLDSTIVALAEYMVRQQRELSARDRSTLMRAAAVLWRAGFNLSMSEERQADPVQH
ncbi:hypothetical protein [Paraburkholderia sp. BL10I2N1]|uniref:hypothetical protein n=1 Tax=Paraburkholderia sp. BL10I2N1 TaxID=1938796 RepID=UPI00105BCE96|nr:hypothetical protein [Paraburkholderia sp. BL10I2N1]TDN69128.1 hypothetical protein B0G77_2499 [Paraburkholderia sp. BL10I2N1]